MLPGQPSDSIPPACVASRHQKARCQLADDHETKCGRLPPTVLRMVISFVRAWSFQASCMLWPRYHCHQQQRLILLMRTPLLCPCLEIQSTASCLASAYKCLGSVQDESSCRCGSSDGPPQPPPSGRQRPQLRRSPPASRRGLPLRPTRPPRPTLQLRPPPLQHTAPRPTLCPQRLQGQGHLRQGTTGRQGYQYPGYGYPGYSQAAYPTYSYAQY